MQPSFMTIGPAATMAANIFMVRTSDLSDLSRAVNLTRQIARERARMTLKIERFQPEGMNVRISNGQPSYSHVVTVSVTRLAGPDFMVEIESVAVVNS